MDAQRTRMLTYRVDDPVGLGQGLFIAESENGPAEAFQLYLAQVISEYDVIPLMDTAVDLQDEPDSIAGEIGEIPADRMLSAKLQTRQPLVAQSDP